MKIKCNKCNKSLKNLGGLIFSPPDDRNQVVKYHVCVSCYGGLFDWIHSLTPQGSSNPKSSKSSATRCKNKVGAAGHKVSPEKSESNEELKHRIAATVTKNNFNL
jgi:hypothetical protein